jgi:hypothetical protein
LFFTQFENGCSHEKRAIMARRGGAASAASPLGKQPVGEVTMPATYDVVLEG